MIQALRASVQGASVQGPLAARSHLLTIASHSPLGWAATLRPSSLPLLPGNEPLFLLLPPLTPLASLREDEEWVSGSVHLVGSPLQK
jgi:hypothetical protein